MFHTGLKPTASQEERAASYRDYVSGALRNPHIVGTHWFQYQDQATTGRGDGENYQIGLVDVCDAPYSETIAAVREVGYALPSIRLEGRIVRAAFRAAPEPPWKWIRENPENHGADAGGLWIRLEPGGLMGGGRDARNILVRPMPAGTRSISVDVETRHSSQFEQAGLIVYRDDDNYLKLVREFVDGKTWVVLVLEVGARAAVLAKVPPPEGTTRLGIDIGEKDVPGGGWGLRALAWGESGPVTGVGEEVVLPGGAAPRIGVFTQSGQAGVDRRARFRDFLIASKPCGSRKDGIGAPKHPER
jgi:hypothetical protein